MRFRPEFPVLTPIFLDNINLIYPVLTKIKAFCLDKFDFVKITLEGEDFDNLFSKIEWATFNFSLNRMSLEIKSINRSID